MTLSRVNELRTLAMLLRQGEAPGRAVGRLASRAPAWRAVGEQLDRGAALEVAAAAVLPGRLAGALAKAGDVPAALDELAALLQQTLRRRRKWGAVLVYPLFVLATMAGALVMLHFAVEPFVPLFEGMSLKLPLPTQIVIMLTKAGSNPALMIPLLVFFGPPLLAVLWLVFGWSRSRLLLPGVGNELRHHEAQGFLSWLGFLVERGLALPEAVRAAAESCSAGAMRRQMLLFAEELEKGSEVGVAVRKLTWFPSLARWLLTSAFRTPSPAAALQEAARLLARDSELQSGNSSALIETVIMILLGLGVGFLVISLFLPLYQLVGNL